ncbi:MAG: hypothetical protein IT222_06905 [Crocinitomix sp.]|nr:hypothetical protein [Crocinitomix sp.]
MKFYSLLLLAFLASCANRSTQATNYTETATDTTLDMTEYYANNLKFQIFEVDFHDGGGMYPESENIKISLDTAVYEHYLHGSTTTNSWKPALADLQGLHQTFLTNSYDKITSDISEGEVYDRGGTTIVITIDDKRIRLSDSGRHFVKPEWKVAFGNIESAIRAYAMKQKASDR